MKKIIFVIIFASVAFQGSACSVNWHYNEPISVVKKLTSDLTQTSTTQEVALSAGLWTLYPKGDNPRTYIQRFLFWVGMVIGLIGTIGSMFQTFVLSMRGALDKKVLREDQKNARWCLWFLLLSALFFLVSSWIVLTIFLLMGGYVYYDLVRVLKANSIALDSQSEQPLTIIGKK